MDNKFLYSLKGSVLTQTELMFAEAIKRNLPEGYELSAQANLATFIDRLDDARYRNELFRNVDFLVVDKKYAPILVIEINDETHQRKDRQERDIKVARICGEAGIPIVKLWTKYGVNEAYIKSKIKETIAALPIERKAFFLTEENNKPETKEEQANTKKEGCYIATCVYGSYDCDEVLVLRNFRDEVLQKTLFGKLFVKIYYAVSPVIVRIFKNSSLFHRLTRKYLDAFVRKLENKRQ